MELCLFGSCPSRDACCIQPMDLALKTMRNGIIYLCLLVKCTSKCISDFTFAFRVVALNIPEGVNCRLQVAG